MDVISEAVIFPRLVVGPVMTGEEQDLFWRFTKMKPPTFYDTEAEDIYEFIIDCHQRQ